MEKIELLAENQCPRCGGFIPNDLTPGAYPGALSRWDNETYVCSSCGQSEAMIQWSSNDKDLKQDHEQWYLITLQKALAEIQKKEGNGN